MNPADLPTKTLQELHDFEAEQEYLGWLGMPPNAAEWEVFYRLEAQ